MTDIQPNPNGLVQAEPDPDGWYRCKVPGCTKEPTESRTSFQMHMMRAHPTPEQAAKWLEGVAASNQARIERNAAERVANLTAGDVAQAPTGNVLDELAETEANRRTKAQDAERKRLERAAKRQQKLLDANELYERVGKSIDVLYPKITGAMVPELAELFADLADRLQREHQA